MFRPSRWFILDIIRMLLLLAPFAAVLHFVTVINVRGTPDEAMQHMYKWSAVYLIAALLSLSLIEFVVWHFKLYRHQSPKGA